MGCTVPSKEAVEVQRFCTDVGRGFQDATLRLTENATCDRGVAVEVQAQGFSPGCVRVSLQDRDQRELATTSLKGTTQVTPNNPAHLRVLLSEQQGTAFDLVATAHYANCEGTSLAQARKQVEVPKGSVLGVQLVVSATDVDGDGYVDVGTSGTDCDDHNAQRHPGAQEVCNGVDDNCADGETEAFIPWFVDEDGDGWAGTPAGMGCTPPVPGASPQSLDCDENSPFIAQGIAEMCDRLDNNCDGRVDEGCSTSSWVMQPDAGTSDWTALAAYAPNNTWLATGTGVVSHVGDHSLAKGCSGFWRAAWSSRDGQVFLASASNGLASTIPGVTTCYETSPPSASNDLTGITGLESAKDGGVQGVYAVASNGKIFHWSMPFNVSGAVTQLDMVPASLRAVDGEGTTDTLLAVGVRSDGGPAAFRFNPDGGPWLQEDLDAPHSSGLLSVDVVDSRLAYAVADNGSVLARERGVWRMLPPLMGSEHLTDVVAYGRSGVYVSSLEGRIHLFNGSTWQTVYTGLQPLTNIDGPLPTEIWAVGHKGTVLRYKP
ncbi:putative metal-binding motif-containing protein [Corallococcus sp. BB11-1]|uniref:putative metal-binding motif-containing protein n=1 Tax=Corallococcus sp. BB11-1 TaxID=2996783 RepID=UPI00226EC369|nr:putative metal-binding motif-containing protein [Corallococcus sp. BB11-1]MCY1034229.1 putative metal-binding motif-containing protein [Corallococcus sp. BB11-1]